MTTVRLCLPSDSDFDVRVPGIGIDCCLSPAVCDAKGSRSLSAGLLRGHFPEPPPEDYVAVTTSRRPAGIEKLIPLISCLESGEAVMVHQQNSVPRSLLESLPETVWGFLHRPQPEDICCLPNSVLSNAAEEDSLVTLWLQNRAFSAELPSPPDVSRFPELGPGKPCVSPRELTTAVRGCDEVRELDSLAGDCFLAGILLLWDCLEESHQVSQSLEGQGSPLTADYWHGIMHRREPDPGNAGYWFRRVGHHPAMTRLHRQLPGWLDEIQLNSGAGQPLSDALSGDDWDPHVMIRACSTALSRPDSAETHRLRAVQYLEILNLLSEPWV